MTVGPTACMLAVLLVVLLIVVYFTTTTTTSTTSPDGDQQQQQTAPPLGTGLSLAGFSLQKWDTLQNFLSWRSEMTRLDGLLQTLREPEPARPDSADPAHSAQQ